MHFEKYVNVDYTSLRLILLTGKVGSDDFLVAELEGLKAIRWQGNLFPPRPRTPLLEVAGLNLQLAREGRRNGVDLDFKVPLSPLLQDLEGESKSDAGLRMEVGVKLDSSESSEESDCEVDEGNPKLLFKMS